MAKKPTLRYFARFKEDRGYLRAVIRYGQKRKYITTPIPITQAQLGRLDTAGHIRIETNEDAILEGRLRDFTSYVWKVVTPLIDTGEFDSALSWEISHSIYATIRDTENARRQRVTEAAEANLQRAAEEAAAKGEELIRITIEEFQRLNEELKATLSPEEYAALWRKGGEE